MLSKKQKAVYMASGGAAAATLVWLLYAESASTTRSFLKKAGTRVGRTLGGIQRTLVTIRERVEAVDRIVRDLAQVGSDHKARAEMVVNDTLGRLEQTTTAIQRNLTQSSDEIAALVKDIRNAVRQSVSPKVSEVA